MISYLRRASSYQPIFIKQNFQFSSQQLTETQSQAVQRHRAIIAMRIIKLIQINPYKDCKIPLNFNIEKSFYVAGSNGVVLQQHETPEAQPLTGQTPSTQNKEPQPFPFLTTRIIELIKNYSESNKNFNETNLKISSNQTPEQIAQRKMLSFFRGGVWVHEDLCSQQRFNPKTESYQILLQKKQTVEEAPFQAQKEKEKYSQNYKQLIFCPTYLVTGQVFRLVQSRNKYLLITGQYGSGKSYSFILYRLLSNIIFRYKHRFCPDKKKLPSEIDLNYVPKLVYWSLDFQKSSQEEVEAIIMRQCYELKKQDPNFQLFNQRGGQRKLSIIYQNYLGINVFLLDDQIQVLASAQRQFDRYFVALNKLRKSEKYKNLVLEAERNPQKQIELKEYKKEMNQQIKNQIEEYYDTISRNSALGDKLNIIKQKVRVQFDKVFYLSSKTIEPNQMIYLNLNGQQKHSPISKTEFEYWELLKKPPSISDSVEFISFLFEQKYIDLNKKDPTSKRSQVFLTEEQQQFLCQLREELFEILSNNEFMISPYAATLSFQKSLYQNLNVLQQFSKEENRSKLNENLQAFIDKLNEKSYLLIKQQINRFLAKNQTPQMGKIKRILLLKLLYAAKTKINQRIQHPQNQSQDTLFQIHLSQLFTKKTKQLQMEIDLHLDRNLFRYNDQTEIFTCLLHEQAILKLLVSFETELLQAYLDSDQKIYDLNKNNSAKGHFVESLLINCLKTKNTTFQMELIKTCIDNANKITQKQLVSFSKLSQEIKYFTPIPKINEKKYRFFNFLEGFGKKLYKLSDGCHLLLPSSNFLKVENEKDIKILDSSNSKLIDFIIVRRIGKDFTITAFDATISLKDAKNKISEFLVEFANFEDRQKQQFTDKKYKFSLHYVVLIPRVPQGPLGWQALYDQEKKKRIEKLQEQKKYTVNSQLVESLDKKIKLLQQLTFSSDSSYSEVSLTEEGLNQAFKQVLLKSVAVSSFLDATIINDNPQMISLYVRLLDRYRKQFEEKEAQQKNEAQIKIKQDEAKAAKKQLQNKTKSEVKKNSQNSSSQKDSLNGDNQTREINMKSSAKSQTESPKGGSN